MKAVLDTNVIVSAALSPHGAPAALLRAWVGGAFDLIASPLLLEELERVLVYPKLRQLISTEEAAELVELVGRQSVMVDDPTANPPVRSPDPGDDYLIALAATARAMLVTGDGDLLGLADQIPVMTAAEFLRALIG